MADENVHFGLYVGTSHPWPELVERAKEAEQMGWDSIWTADHFFNGADEMMPFNECYTTLAALATVTEKPRLGVMVASVTHRNPIVLLKLAVTVDHISNGRVDFGIGAGFWEREHQAYSFDFPPAGERVEMLDEAMQAIESFQANERTTLEGKHYHYDNAPFEPKPIQERLPVMIACRKPRMLRLTAKYADQWNTRAPLDEAAEQSAYLTEQCEKIGRDPAEIVRSTWPGPSQLESVEMFREYVQSYYDAGFRHFMAAWPDDPGELKTLRAVSEQVLPEIRSK